MGESECCSDEVADFAGAGGGVLKGSPALGEEREAAFSLAAHCAEEQVVGPVVDGEGLPSAGCLIGVYTPWPAPS